MLTLRTTADLKGRRVLVSGALGKTGRSMVELLLRVGAVVLATDVNADGDLPEGVTDLRPHQDPSVLDSHAIEVVCMAPGVPLSLPLFRAARQLGLPLLGDLDLGTLALRDRCAMPVLLALTGTDGKTTTTALIAHLLREAGVTALECGNYGLPFSSVAMQESLPSVLVCECSSYQLENLHFFRPDGALVLNIAPDHMDRYERFADYLAAKLNILSLQQRGDVAVLGESVIRAAVQEGVDGGLDRARASGVDLRTVDISCADGDRARMCGSDSASLPWSDFGSDSRTNRLNACAALSLLDAMVEQGRGPFAAGEDLPHGNAAHGGLPHGGLPHGHLPHGDLRRRLLDGLRSFRGLPHRQERVAVRDGILYVNDSKATTVHATLSAVSSFVGKKVFLLVGGLEKNTDFTTLRESDDVRLYPFGRAADKIAAHTGVNRTYAGLEEAVSEARRDARLFLERHAVSSAGSEPACVILLSPACASQDAYRNYEERGQHFRRLALA